jgi:hypothetical protein
LLGFYDFVNSLEGKQWIKEKQRKYEFFAVYFFKQQIDKLDEGVLHELTHVLSAFNSWTNKDWLLQEMLRSDLSMIRNGFKQLLYGSEPLAKRFDNVKNTVRMMGSACISEILAHHHPREYPIWNSRSRGGLIALGVDEAQLPKSAQISGTQYVRFCNLVQGIRK